ncbi:MAG: hypothetical protein JWM21_4795 [Acidobacteria bacterium]|nr:hypothetical protein [Acidobacteriota bacterium]
MNIVQGAEVQISKVGELNFLVCVVVAFASAITLWRLTQCRKTVYDFVFRATLCWTAAWVVWIGLWAITWRVGVPTGNWHWLSLALSDVNTMLQLLFCVGLIQGSRFKGKEYGAFAAMMLAFVVTAAVFIHFFPGQTSQEKVLLIQPLREACSQATQQTAGAARGAFDVFKDLCSQVSSPQPTVAVAERLQERWSLAIGMFASLVIGWGFKVRYGTMNVLIVGFLYAIMQPPAYEALYGELKSTDSALVLTLLAALKVVFALSVVYYLGIQPTDGRNLVHIEEEKPNAEKHDLWWPSFPRIFLLVGGCVVGVELWRFSSASVKTGSQIIVLIVSAAGFLRASEYLNRKFLGNKQKD